MNVKTMLGASALALGFAAATPANAALIFLSGEAFSGSGLGNVSTILTIHDDDDSVSGGVAFNGTRDVLSGDASRGSSQTRTRSIGEIGNPAPSNFRIVFNAAEPGGNSINLTRLVLTIFSATGNTLFTSSLASSQFFANTNTGIGNSGFVFGFDAADTLAAASAFGTSTNRIGLSARTSDAAGGPETFFVATRSAPAVAAPPVAVPAPASFALFGAGLLGLAMVRRRRSR